MLELPLFPLNTVLFPGMPLNLHIFEPRYQQMVNACLQTRKPFGVVLIQDGQEAGAPLADPCRIGTTARILRIERLPDGRMNILTVGEERFNILSLGEHPDGYLLGDVEFLPSLDDDHFALRPALEALRPKVEQYLHLLTEAEILQSEVGQLPLEPMELAYMAAFLIQSEAHEKQSLLECESAGEFMGKALLLYRKEITVLNMLLAAPPPTEGLQGRLN